MSGLEDEETPTDRTYIEVSIFLYVITVHGKTLPRTLLRIAMGQCRTSEENWEETYGDAFTHLCNLLGRHLGRHLGRSRQT